MSLIGNILYVSVVEGGGNELGDKSMNRVSRVEVVSILIMT